MNRSIMLNFMKVPSLTVLIFALLIACQPPEEAEPDTYPNAHLLADVNWLAVNLGAEDLVIVDMRDEMEGGTIPGAIELGGIGALVDEDHDVPSFLVGPEMFTRLMNETGIDNNSRVVIFDEGNSLRAARLFFALERYGHDQVQVLNGGFAAWREAGLPIADAPAEPLPATFTAAVNERVSCELEDILAAIEDDNIIILDVRSEEEYSGDVARAERGGHIPGAVHLEWTNMLTEGDVPEFKSVSEIRSIFDEKGLDRNKEIITHCQSNVRGAHTYFVLRLMGYENIRAYEGSWNEYGNLEEVPISSL